MEETDVEEGEARSYHGQDEDSTIDPDISLSYIGEKLESVLGHFQKDFEGGVSAENLGAKFGGYGSFLPTCQRSPSWSRTKSPLKVNNHDTPVSPRKLWPEDQRQNSLASSSSSPTARLPDASGKSLSIENSLKGLPSRRVDESGFKCGVIKKSVNSYDQKTLKVRIKVGSDNLSTQKNTEIYSGLGLMVSPSSSLDDSQEATVQKLSGNRLDVPEKSPTSILQIMTSFSAVHLLSPLSEDLICLIGKRKIGGNDESVFMDKAHIETSRMLVNGSLPGRSDQNVVEQNKWKSSEKNLVSIESTDRKNFSSQSNSASAVTKEKETDIDTLHCEEMVSNALKLPLISNSQYTVDDAAKGMCTTAAIVPLNASKSGVKGEAGRDIIKKKLDSESSLETDRIEKLGERMGSLGKDSGNKKEICSTATTFSQKNVLKEEKYYASDQSDSNVSKSRNEPTVGPSDLPKKIVGAHAQKDQQMVDSSFISKSGKNSHANSLLSKNDSRDLQKAPEKSRQMHLKDFFGDFGFEEEDDESTSKDMPSSGRPKDPQLLKKRNSSEYISTSKEKSNDKSVEKLNPTENYHKLPSHVAPPPTSEALTGVAPIVKEDWVLCDKCRKWRLLPLGTNPKSLPEKWLCRMLTWLPGMNRCSIPEEETTRALTALYHQPIADSTLAPDYEKQHNQLHNSISAIEGVPLVDAGCPVQELQNIADLNESTGQKKKHRGDHSSSLLDIDGSSHSANSRKNRPTSSKNGILNIGNHSPPDSHGFQSNKKESLVNCTKTGKNLKINNKLESDADDFKASKRMKVEAYFDNGKWSSENAGSSLNGGTISANGLSNKSSRPKDTRVNMKDTGLNQEIKVPGDGLMHSRKFDNKDSVRKRKGKDFHGSQSCHQNSGDFVDGWDSDQLERKKARVSKSGGKGSSGSKSRAGTDEKGGNIDKQNNNQYLNNTPIEDCLKIDRGLVHSSVAANSSSSKVSGSHKNKINPQEVKGSPVESVSSSPLRLYNADKVPSTTEKLFEKDDLKDPYSSTAVSPKRISGGEDGGNVRKEVMKKDVSRNIDSSVLMSKSEKVSSHSKDKTHTAVSDMDKDKIKEKTKSRKNKFDHRSGTPAKIDKLVSKNNTAGRTLSESSKVLDQSKFGGHDSQDLIKSQDKKRNLEEKLLKRSNLPEANGNGVSQSRPPLGKAETEKVTSLQSVTGSQKENGLKLLSSNQCKKAEKENGRHINLRHPTPNSHKVQDVESSSPVQRESSSHGANNALKEAKDLKHLADRLKNSGSPESNGLYFQAALKFLHGASLLETGSSDGSKHNEMMHSMHIYSSTAKLCEFCAREFEKSKDMATAALAYKCMEVAYMRVVYYSHSSANRDRNELQSALHIVAPGESPFSSTSDVDNLNQATTDKGNAVAKVIGSPQVSGSHTITSQNRSGFIRLLNFAQDVNFAMEASRKSRNAFTTAISKLGESDICSLKMALDFNFQDVEGLLRLVRVSMEAINHR